MFGADCARPGEIGDRTCDPQDAVVRASRKQQPRERVAEQFTTLASGGAVPIDVARAEEGVGFALSRKLRFVRACHARRDVGAALAGRRRASR